MKVVRMLEEKMLFVEKTKEKMAAGFAKHLVRVLADVSQGEGYRRAPWNVVTCMKGRVALLTRIFCNGKLAPRELVTEVDCYWL
jgi:hypothetical protein